MVLASDMTETEGSYGAALFYISVKMNPFTPSSWITTIRAGSRSDGAVVADFESVSLIVFMSASYNLLPEWV
jgi:hypothetical protein